MSAVIPPYSPVPNGIAPHRQMRNASDRAVVELFDHDEDAEACLVSCAISPRIRRSDVASMPSPSDLYDGLHSAVYAAAVAIVEEKGRQDHRLLVARLRTQGIEPGAEYWRAVRERAAQPENIEEYAESVRYLSSVRLVKNLGHSLVTMAKQHKSGERHDLLAAMDRAVEDVYRQANGTGIGRELVTLQDAARIAMERIRNPQMVRRIPFGIPMLDDALSGGLAENKLLTIAGPPGGGKTSLMLALILHSAATSEARWLIVSKEMTADELAEQMILIRAGVDGKRVRAGANLTREEWDSINAAEAAIQRMVSDKGVSQVMIVPPIGLSAAAVISMIRQEHARHGLNGAAVDYLQILDWPDEATARGQTRRNRTADTLESRLSEDAQAFKDCARQCHLSMVLLSQLNRGDSRHGSGNPVPTLASLKGSGGIAAASDLVVALHCALSDEEQQEEIKSGRAVPVTAHILKGRFTGKGVVPLDFEPQFTRFKDRGTGGTSQW